MAKRALPHKNVVETKKVEPKKEEKVANLVVDYCDHLGVRSSANADSYIAFVVQKGTVLVPEGEVADLVQVHLLSNPDKKGYVLAKYVRKV